MSEVKRARDAKLMQITEDAPLAKRTKKEEKQYEKIKKLTTEVDKKAWNKAIELVNGEWNPFADRHRRCFASRHLQAHFGDDVHQKLLFEFKRAVLSQNWNNAVKLISAIFKNFSSFNERVYLKALLSLLLSHPRVNKQKLSDMCSFLWKLDDEMVMDELLRCFCSMPKDIPTEFVHQTDHFVFVRKDRVFKGSKYISIKYTSHIGTGQDNELFRE